MKIKKFEYKNVNSTNDVAIRIIKNTKNKYGIIISEKQKKGRGQFGKKWVSYKGNLFVSIFYSLEKINLSLKQLTKLNCLLIKKLLSRYYNNKILIKPPNDIFIKKKKICGILQETLKKANTSYLIVGIGINLVKSPNINNYPTTNLLELTKKKVNKNEMILNLKYLYEDFVKQFSNIKVQAVKNL